MKEKKFTVDGRIWLTISNENSVGEGKILLLEKIHKLGSLRQAAIEMKMSYQQAWNIINKLNHEFESPLVILTRGGRDGGKAEITPEGMEIINIFKNTISEFEEFLRFQNDKLIL